VTYDGTLDTETKEYNDQIQTLSDRINTMNDRINKQVDTYKQQFIDIQNLLDEAQQTQQMIQSFASYGYSF
jgi:flagellar capping protein FliD